MANTASRILGGKGYETFLPLYRSRRRWSDRVKHINVALFPGYLFCRFDPLDRLVPVLTTPGVLSIVSSGKAPVPVAEEEIEAVQMIVRSGLAARPRPFLQVGSKVHIDQGPLTGLDGIIAHEKNTSRLVVSVTLLQRSVAVEIDSTWARPANELMAPDLQTRTGPCGNALGSGHD